MQAIFGKTERWILPWFNPETKETRLSTNYHEVMPMPWVRQSGKDVRICWPNTSTRIDSEVALIALATENILKTLPDYETARTLIMTKYPRSGVYQVKERHARPSVVKAIKDVERDIINALCEEFYKNGKLTAQFGD